MTDIVPLLNSEQESQKEMQRLYELLKLGEWNKAASALKGPLRTMDIFQQFKAGGELAIRTYFNTLLRRNEHLTKVFWMIDNYYYATDIYMNTPILPLSYAFEFISIYK